MKDSSPWTRRKFVEIGAVAGTGLLAGCTGGDDSSGDGGDGNTSGDGEDGSSSDDGEGGSDRFAAVIGRPLPEVQFNPFNIQNYGQTISMYLNVSLADGHADGTVQSRFLEDISTDGREMTMSIPEGWTYWNGDEITAEDLYTGLELTRYQNYDSTNYESHEIVDDYTVKRTFKSGVTPTLMQASLVGETFVHPELFSDYLEQYEDAGSADERESVTEELIQYTISAEEYIDGGYGTGVYRPTEWNNSRLDAELVEDHPMAESTDVPAVRIYAVGGESEAMARNNTLDRAYAHPNDTWMEGTDLEIERTINWFRAQKFILNWNNEHLANLNVRRAVMAIMPLEAMSAAANEAGYNAEPTQLQTGLRESIHGEYLGEDFTDQLIEYPVASDSEAAAEYMRAADYTKEGGSWVSPDGEQISFDILSRSNTGQALPTTAFSDALNRFGIETEVNAIGEDYYTTLQNWDFDMGWVWHVASALWHPTSYFSNDFYGVRIGDPEETEGTGETGIPLTTTIPSEIGAEEISGSGQEIRPAQLSNDLPASESTEEVREKTRTLAWWFNYSLPAIAYIQENQTRAMDTANFEIVSDKDPSLDVSEPIMKGLFNGRIRQNSS